MFCASIPSCPRPFEDAFADPTMSEVDEMKTFACKSFLCLHMNIFCVQQSRQFLGVTSTTFGVTDYPDGAGDPINPKRFESARSPISNCKICPFRIAKLFLEISVRMSLPDKNLVGLFILFYHLLVRAISVTLRHCLRSMY